MSTNSFIPRPGCASASSLSDTTLRTTCTTSEIELSIVTTLYNSAPYIQEFCQRILEQAKRITERFELILVNDGSPDESLDIVCALCESDYRIKVVDLSRNFGHHKAMMTGLAHASGQRVFLIDCDLEEQPELLAEFYKEFERSDSDVVYGVQQERSGSWFRKITGQISYTLINKLMSFPVPRNVCTVRLMSCRFVHSLLSCSEREVNIAGLWAYVGYRQTALPIEKQMKASSDYTLTKRFSVTIRWITGFSSIPLVMIAYLGGLILFLSTLWIAYLVAIRLFFGNPPNGYTSLIVSVWFLGGLILFSLGIVAIYLSVMFSEVKRRPFTIERAVYQKEAQSRKAAA